MTQQEIEGQILWFESLLDSIEDDKKAEAIEAIKAAIKLLRRQRLPPSDRGRLSAG